MHQQGEGEEGGGGEKIERPEKGQDVPQVTMERAKPICGTRQVMFGEVDGGKGYSGGQEQD